MDAHEPTAEPIAATGSDEGHSPMLACDALPCSSMASRLARLTQQHSSTLHELFSLRLQQLMLRRRQVSALKSLIVAQARVLTNGADAAVANMVVRSLAATRCSARCIVERSWLEATSLQFVECCASGVYMPCTLKFLCTKPCPGNDSHCAGANCG